jgi:hypothetical protein
VGGGGEAEAGGAHRVAMLGDDEAARLGGGGKQGEKCRKQQKSEMAQSIYHVPASFDTSWRKELRLGQGILFEPHFPFRLQALPAASRN